MSAGNDDIVQQLNRAVARASVTCDPEDTLGAIDRRLAEKRRERKNANSISVDSRYIVLPFPLLIQAHL